MHSIPLLLKKNKNNKQILGRGYAEESNYNYVQYTDRWTYNNNFN